MSISPTPTLTTPTPGEAVYTAYLEKSKRTSASILGWEAQSLREDLRKFGWTGGDIEDAVTYWSSLSRGYSQGFTGDPTELCEQAIQLLPPEKLEEVIYRIPAALTTVQQNKLKKYYKLPLPIQRAHNNVNANLDLRFLPAINGVPATPLEELRRFLSTEVGLSSRRFCALVGPSGCGKTWSVFQLTDGDEPCFVIYFDCSWRSRAADQAYHAMVEDIREGIRKVKAQNISDVYEHFKLLNGTANARANVEWCARLLFLYVLRTRKPSLTPREHLDSQLNGGVHVLKKLVSWLMKIDVAALAKLREFLATTIHAWGKNIVCCIDDANAARDECGYELISMTAINNRNSLVNAKSIPHSHLRRGVLGALCYVVGLTVHVNPLVVGPTEEELDEIGTLLGKQHRRVIKSFSPWSVEQVNTLSNSFLEGLANTPELTELCPIRPRWWEILVNEMYSPASVLKERLPDAIDLEATVGGITKFICESEIKFTAFKLAIPLLCRLVAASFLITPEPLWIHIPGNPRAYIESSVCFLQQDLWRIAEPLVLEAALIYLQKQGVSAPLSQSVITTTNQMLELTGMKTAEKGVPFEYIVACSLKDRFSNKLLVELIESVGFPVDEIPHWCKETLLTIDGIVAQKRDDESDIIQFLIERRPGILLKPPNSMRPDWILFLKDDCMLVISITFHTTPVSYMAASGKSYLDNLNASDPNMAFTKGTNEYKHLRNAWTEELKKKPVTKVVRLSIVLPHVTTKPHIRNEFKVIVQDLPKPTMQASDLADLDYDAEDPPAHSFLQRDKTASTSFDFKTQTFKEYRHEHLVLHFDKTNIDKLLVPAATQLVKLVLETDTVTTSDFDVDMDEPDRTEQSEDFD